MKKEHALIFTIVFIIAIGVNIVGAVDTPTSASKPEGEKAWRDITGKIAYRQGEQKGFTEDPKGKIFSDAENSQLKIVTETVGEFLIDIKNQKVYLKKDGAQIEKPDYKLKQRNRGLMVVIIGDKFRIQCTMTEKVPGIEKIEGLSAM